jgi:translation initiation factor IF-2
MNTSKKGRAAEKNMQRGSLRKRDRSREQAEKEERALERRTVYLTGEAMTVADFAETIGEKPIGVIKFLMTDLGIMASMTQSLDPATCIAVAESMGKVVAGLDDDEEDDEDYEDDDEPTEKSALEVGFAIEEEDPDTLIPRPPVVTIMGHVDHGKTSLLDALRNTRVVAGEAGGITQHIGAYQIEKDGQKITFIDTPGHAAFTDMRQRGANITDIVILVVAADDGVKQQTADSLICARQAGVPIVVAVNKIDLPTANVDRVLADLTAYDVLTEALGGDVLSQQISAKENTNLDELLEKVLLQAEVLDLKANPDREAQGAVVEANVEKGLGAVATTLIQKGTLKVGDVFVAGATYGRVKALFKTDGKTRIDEAGPSTPVKVVGFNTCPGAGDILVVCDSEQKAKELAENRARIQRERESAAYQAGLRESVAATFAGGKIKERREMCVVLKADVQGSAEALARSLSELKLENEEAFVTVKVLVSEAGEVTKSDVAMASVTPGTTIIAFNCAANYAATEDARQLGINIEYYSIVYDAIESVESRMQEVLSPTPEGEYVGAAIVQEVFNIGGVGNIAGSRCQDGIIKKGSNVRVMRGDKILAESKVKSLRNFKAEVDSIETGDECGIGLMDFEEFLPGDIIESYVVK